jgi:hypothetical protein
MSSTKTRALIVILLPIESEVSRYFFAITPINAYPGLGRRNCGGTAKSCATRFTTLKVRRGPVGSGLRPFGEGNRARTYFIWSPGSCRWSWGWRSSELG